MAEFLTTSGIAYQIENIIIGAKKKLYLVSPYLQISKILFERLNDASLRGVEIKIIFGKNELKQSETELLAVLKNVTLYYLQNLHAKCYFNETLMVITSMNMYEFSEKNNREMGVLIDAARDTALFQKAADETGSIMKSAKIVELSLGGSNNFNEPSGYGVNKKSDKVGHCIRCESRIPYNPGKPYCPDCFAIWVQYQNPEFQENVCHACGDYVSTSMESPMCYSCFFK